MINYLAPTVDFHRSGHLQAPDVRLRLWEVLLLGLVVLPYFVNLGQAGLWDSNEAFYAETPREMLESGDYVVPRFNYYFRWQKPPLSYWAVAASYRLFGVSEWSARLPIALAAVAWVILCYWAGRRWFNRHVALIAAIMLAANFRVFIMSRRAITEIWLAFFVSLALALLAIVMIERPKRSTVVAAAAYTSLGLAIMTKGPVALALVCGAVFAYIIWRRHPSLISDMRLPLGVSLLALIVLPWYWRVVSIVGWQPVLNFIWSDNLGRYLSEEFGPSRGPAFYLRVLMVDFFPWSILVLVSLLALTKPAAIRWDVRRIWPPRVLSLPFKAQVSARSVSGWLALWICLVLVFFSLSKNKQEYYILPLYMPACLLAARVLTSLKTVEGWRKRLLQVALCVLGACFVLIGPPAALLMRNLMPGLPRWQVILMVLVFAGGGGWICLTAVRYRWQQCLSAVLCTVWASVVGLALFIMPQWEAYKPVREFAQWIASHRRDGDYAGYYKYSAPSLAFYLREPIFEIIWENQIIHFLSTTPRRTFCIIQQDHFDAIRPHLAQSYQVVASRPILGLRAKELLQVQDLSKLPQILLICNSP